MITVDILAKNSALAGLTDEQRSAIVELSQNDESAVIGAKTGEIYRKFDEIISAATGVPRNGDEKTYDYLKRAGEAVKAKADAAGQKVVELEALKTKLEQSSGAGDSEKLQALKTELATTKAQFIDLKAKFDDQENAHKTALNAVILDTEIQKSLAGLKFKTEYPKDVTDVLLENAVQKLKTVYKPEIVDNGKGGRVLVFKDEAGVIRNNPENNLNPYTAGDFLKIELKSILQEKKEQRGAGTQPPAGGGSQTKGVIDLSAARTKVDAMNIAEKTLLSQGFTRGSAEYQKAIDKAWIDYKVKDLPQS